MPPTELLILHHTHVDIGYTHPQYVAWSLHDRHIDEAIDLCERTADYPEAARMKWTCEVTSVALHWLKTASPAKKERLRKLVANGQFGFGAMLLHWSALHQEDMLRESLLPMKILRDELGADIKHAMQTDVNGMPWSVADMLLDAGIERFMMSVNIHMGGYPLSRPKVFQWQTPSGKELKVFSGEHYNAFTREAMLRNGAPVRNVCEEAFAERMQAGLDRYFVRLREKGWDHDFAILTATHPCMDDNGPPNPQLPDLVRFWKESGRAPLIRIVSLAEMFQRIDQIDTAKLPVHGGDWTDYWTNGVAASALEVTMSRRAHGALWGGRALRTVLPPCDVWTRNDASAVDALHLANEHTWNVYASTGALGTGGSGRIEPIPEAEQRLYKSAQCAAALTFSRMARRDALDALTGNPSQAVAVEGLLVFNPSEIVRRVCLRLPLDLVRGHYHLVAGTKHRIDVIEDVLAETGATMWTGPVEIPAMSYLTLPLTELPSGEFASGKECGPDSISSPFWNLGFDPVSGAITSLVHVGSGNECFDSAAGFDLFGPIQESISKPSALATEARDHRATFFAVTERNYDEMVHEDRNGWETGWEAVHKTPDIATRIRSRSNREGVHLDRWFELPGINGEIRMTISLLRDEDRVRFTAYFNKADISEPESLYFAFPFLMPQARAHFDTAGVVVQFDKGQLPGVSRGWVTAGAMMVVEEDSFGSLTLACPDAPLFQIGGFQYGRDLKCSHGLNQALLLAWPMNNYWNTNFRASQPGLVRFRYELEYRDSYQPGESAKFAAAVARPPMFHPVASLATAPAPGTLVVGLPDCVTIVSLKSEGGDSLLLVLRNHDSEVCVAEPRFPCRSIKSLAILDILEESLTELAENGLVPIPARSVVALRVVFIAGGIPTLHAL